MIDVSQPPRGDSLVLEIENGDNLPLKIDRCQFHYPATRILFKASLETETFLYYGNHKAASPRYDVVLIADRLIAADKTEATLSPAESLRKSSWQALPFRGSPGWLFWVVLGAVVLVLLLVIRRMLPKSDTPVH